MADNTGRDTEIRIMVDMPKNPLEAFKYPFSAMEYSGYDDEELIKDIPGHITADAGDFPNSIIRVFWFREGEDDGEEWILLCLLDNGNYAYYNAWCDRSGFDCRGWMNLYVNNDYSVLINYAMGDSEYDEYMSQTEETKGWIDTRRPMGNIAT